jgi:hypothetical protein
MFTCPVCFYDKMPDVPKDYNICPCCGTEFGVDDELRNYTQLRQYWISTGAKWFFNEAPPTWNPWFQLSIAGVALPYVSTVMVGGPTPNPNFVLYGASPRELAVSSNPYPDLAEAA